MKQEHKHNFIPISPLIKNTNYICAYCQLIVDEKKVNLFYDPKNKTINKPKKKYKYLNIYINNISKHTIEQFNEIKQELGMNKNDLFTYIIDEFYKKMKKKRWRF